MPDINTYYQVPLKFKYRDPRNVPVIKNGTYKARSNAPKPIGNGQGNGPRRRAYFTHVH